RSRAALRHVALTGRAAAREVAGLERVVTGSGVGPGAAVTGIVVAHAGLRGARAGHRGRREAIGRASSARSRAALRHVALTGRAAAREVARLERVVTGGRIRSRTGVSGGVVARAPPRGPRAGHRGGREAVGGASSARSRAASWLVALTGRAAALEATGLERVITG